MTPDKALSSEEELVEQACAAYDEGKPYLSDFDKMRDAIAAIRPTIERELLNGMLEETKRYGDDPSMDDIESFLKGYRASLTSQEKG